MVETCKTCNAKLEGGFEYEGNDQCRFCLMEEIIEELQKRISLIEVHTEVEER